jgi:hypothetical protein
MRGRVGICPSSPIALSKLKNMLKVGEFAFFQLAVDKFPRLLQKFYG